jgi:ABC-type sugar transport systems, permease components
MSRHRRMTLRQKQKIMGLIFISPWLLGFVLFFVFNFIRSVVYSFSAITLNPGGGYSIEFAGLSNFKEAFLVNAVFNPTLTESLGNIVINVPLITFFSLFIAIILNRKFKGRALVRAIFFLPVIMATSAITSAMSSNLDALMEGMAGAREYEQVSGFNATFMLHLFIEYGIPQNIAAYLLGAVSRVYEIIRLSGVQILIFLAALQSISDSLYEVAHIEGATRYEIFWKITFPMVSPLILTNVVYTIVDLYSQSEIVTLAHDTAFTGLNFGLASAMSLVSSVSICIILLIFARLVSKKIFYQT